MTNSKTERRLLLISNSTLFGRGYLDHAEEEIRELMGAKTRIAFIAYALHDRRAYAQKAEERFREMGLSLTSTHDLSNTARAIDEADAVLREGLEIYPDHLELLGNYAWVAYDRHDWPEAFQRWNIVRRRGWGRTQKVFQ